jgi:hypothetical protein
MVDRIELILRVAQLLGRSPDDVTQDVDLATR